jgi:hypothetical protein
LRIDRFLVRLFADAIGGRVWGIGPRLILPNAQKSAETNTPNPAGGVNGQTGKPSGTITSTSFMVELATLKLTLKLKLTGNSMAFKV